MVTNEEFTILIPVLASGIVSLVIILISRHLNVFDKTGKNASLATFNIGVMQSDIDEVKTGIKDSRDHFDKRIDASNALLEKRDESLKSELRRVWERMEILTTSLKLSEYRLDRLEKTSSNDSHARGMGGGA